MADTSYLAVEIGGTKLQAALGTAAGDILAVRRGRADPARGAAAILSWFEREVPALIEENGATPAAIGIGFGGPVESASGTVLVSHQVAGWEGFALRPWFEERFGCDTIVANDANAAGWAEYRCGAGRGTRRFAYMNIGSGIGGALVIDGRLEDGQGRGAGELGHTYVPDWSASTPGLPVKLEHLCSGWAIEKRLRALPALDPESPLGRACGGNPGALTCAMLGPAAEAGDPVAMAELDHVGFSVGLALSNLITLFHPGRIALGGGVSLLGEPLLRPVRGSVTDHVYGPFRQRYEIMPCALGESVVLVGALLLAAGE
ncbi:MAG: ROK family protein [Candidatus Hydrogenedentota bacterium]